MKNNISLIFILNFLLTIINVQSFAQLPDSWTQKADFGGMARFSAVSFSIGAKGYLGTGFGSSSSTKDFWEYDPTTDSWSQKADFGGTNRMYSTGFSIGSKGFIGCGNNNGNTTNDFWEYDPAANSWTQKANFAGVPRQGAVGFSIGSKGYIGTGLINSTTRTNDFWEYDPAMDTWTQKSNVGGAERSYATGFNIGDKGYIGTGNTGTALIKDFWEYDPSLDIWIQKADFGGIGRFQSVGMSIGSFGYIGLGDIGGGYANDFWEYDPSSDSWVQRVSFGGAIRTLATGFSIGDKGFVGTGLDFINGIVYKDIWEYTPVCTTPTITSQPLSQSITYGSSATFTVIADNAVAFQWQEDSGLGFSNISNGGIYSNASTATLNIATPVVSMTGNKYRCVVTGICGPAAITNGIATLSVAAKSLTVTAEDKSKCFDGAIYSGGYTVNYNGFVNNEDQGALQGSLLFGGTAVTAEDPGMYTIIPSGLTSTNYLISYVNGTLSINNSVIPTITGPNSLCAGTSTVQYSTEPGFSNYVWTISYGGIITGGLNTNQVSVNWGTAGSRSISVNYQNSLGCYSPTQTSFEVTVLSVPVPIISGDQSVCSETTDVIYTTQENYENYVWNVSSGGTITAGAGTNSVSLLWNGSNNQTVSVSYTNSLGCQPISPTVFNVFIEPKPTDSGPVIGDNAICAGSNNISYDVSPILSATSYLWTLPYGATIVSGAGTSSILVDFAENATSGIIKVSGVNDCGTGASSPDFNVSVNPVPPVPVITQFGDTLISSADNGNQWFLDGIEIAGANEKKHKAVYLGTYHVIVTQSGCSSDISNSILVQPVSINEVKKSASFDIYPNPSNGLFNIKCETPSNDVYNIEIYSNVGALIWKQSEVKFDDRDIIKVDLSSYPSGVYTVIMRNKTNSIVKKVFVTR